MSDRDANALITPHLWWSTERGFDVVIVGAGIAGLACALRLPAHLRVAIVMKGALGESNTRYAQGGLAAAMAADDSPELHFADTIDAGAGLCDPDAVRSLVGHGADAVEWLLAHGTQFDRDGAIVALGREAAHSRNRVLHAGGDATGAEIERSLVHQLRDRETVTILEHTVAIDIMTDDAQTCAGIIVHPQHSNERVLLRAGAVVLANGGAGHLWAVTSNPPGATADGIALAMRAGVAIADIEFTQFHPTVLAGTDLQPFLISEAVRGEGAWLRNASGDRFMLDLHPFAELAPRDVVARAIQEQITTTMHPVQLDLRHLDGPAIRRRFPTINHHLTANGLDLTKDLIPVAPAAHYFMGGIVASVDGRTSLPGLYAIGEVACTGVHGANRLASNSLLEGLVFGLHAANDIGASALTIPPAGAFESAAAPRVDGPRNLEHTLRQSRQIMSQHVAVVRSHDGLNDAEQGLLMLANDTAGLAAATLRAETARTMLAVSLEIVRSALVREESRGAHYRLDFPERNPKLNRQHLILRLENNAMSRAFGALGDDIAQRVSSTRAPFDTDLPA